MKTILIVSFIILSFASRADQLAFITEEQAEQAVQYIMDNPKLLLFCGCCDMKEPRKVKVVEAVAVSAGYENYYEVEIMYEGEDGEYVYERIDLAYVWSRKLFKYKTLGAIMDMEHDQCVYVKDWKKPENQEKDI